MLIADLDYSFFGWNSQFAIYGPYNYSEDWHEYPDYSSDPPVNKGDFLPIIDNTDPNKYYPVTVNGQTYKIYNSAILNNSTGLYICLICDRPWNSYQLWHDGRQSGEAWVQYQSINAIAQNGVYTCGYDDETPPFEWHSDGFLYNIGSYYDKEITVFNSIETELPIFTNNNDFMDYITGITETATVRVNYYVPAGDYQFTKITYKKDKEPASVNDGTVVDIDITQTEVTIGGLAENNTYYFTIFTDISESNSVSFTVEPNPVPPEYREYIDTINGSGFFWKDFTYTNAASPYPAVNPVPATVSFYNRRVWTNTQNPIGNQTNGTGSMMVSSIMTFNITSSNDSVTATLSGYNPEIQEGKTVNNVYYIPFEAVDQVFRNIASSINAYTFNNSYRIAVFEYQFNTLQICLQCIAAHFRNVNIYVDGVLWSKVS